MPADVTSFAAASDFSELDVIPGSAPGELVLPLLVVRQKIKCSAFTKECVNPEVLDNAAHRSDYT